MKYSKVDRIYRLPRIWSNNELRKFSHLYDGHVINVSAWQDKDKEGAHYKNYFNHAASYSISNFKAEMRGMQGYENEIFLDLEASLPAKLKEKFDVVFNHTTLEHIFDISTAFRNLCNLSKDTVIMVVPFLQEMHGSYGDFWRFSPQAIDRLFNKENYELLYLSYNNHKNASVYIFAIASKIPGKWQQHFEPDQIELNPQPNIGFNVYKRNSLWKN